LTADGALDVIFILVMAALYAVTYALTGALARLAEPP